MLTVWEAIKARRSIRKFAPDDVPDEMIDQMLEAARLAPSGSNTQPWRFIVVREKEKRRELRRLCFDQKFIEEAPVVIVCLGDLERYSLDARKRRRQEFTDFGVMETLSGRFADPRFWAQRESVPPPPREQFVTPVTANTYIAIEHMALMATALGLGTCWVGGVSDVAQLRALFGLADSLVLVAILPVGYPAGSIPPPRPRLTRKEIVLEAKAEPVTTRVA